VRGLKKILRIWSLVSLLLIFWNHFPGPLFNLYLSGDFVLGYFFATAALFAFALSELFEE